MRPLLIPDNTLASKTIPPIKKCGTDQQKPVNTSTDHSQSQNLNGCLITTATAVIQNPTSVTITVTSSTNISTITVPLPKSSVTTPTVTAKVCHKSKDELEGEILDKKSTSSINGSIDTDNTTKKTGSQTTSKKTTSQTVKNLTHAKPQSTLTTKTAVSETETSSDKIISRSHADSNKSQIQTKFQDQSSTNKFHTDSSKRWTQTSTNKYEADSNKPQTQTSTGKSQAGSSKQQTQTSTNKSHAYSMNNQTHSKPTVPVNPIVRSNMTLIPTVSQYYSHPINNPYSNIQHSHNTTCSSYLPYSHPPYYAPPNFPQPYPPFSSSTYHHYGYQ